MVTVSGFSAGFSAGYEHAFDNPPFGGYLAKQQAIQSIYTAWAPLDPTPTVLGYRTSFVLPLTSLVPRRGRFVFAQPDIRAVIIPPDEPGSPMDPVNIVSMYWTAAGPNDTDYYYVILDTWLPSSGDTVSSPTVTITAIAGDATPPVASSVSVDTGTITLTVAPGIPYVSAGPRIKVKIVGGTVGNTYSTVVGWQDSQGRAIFRTVLLPIEAR